ncbi:hypothetical protein [Peredibacter starrii]|uniref:Outer membrane protein beta-barrel domain-containing protein n=1 Tax=Peredibacter starrii TaxID=28202 RepID=A0AAX4HSC4_9BACT|nr:hypothetical protein [Peredibacter starrii]WPU66265.1 hypothetical protein SOO65_05850 [Peredibacter starrii]
MKALVLLFILAFSFSSLAQNHMVEFNGDAIMYGAFNHSKTKSKEQATDETNNGALYVNVARTVSDHIQFAIQGNYLHADYSAGFFESYAFLLGGIYNLDTDFRKSYYAGVYAGMGWENNSLNTPNSHEEKLVGKVVVGKRFPLEFLNLENVTYSPELAFTSETATKSSSDEQWSQNLAIKFLQFSVFF